MTETALGPPERAAPVEVRVDGNRLTATMPYGTKARDRAERFGAQALAPAADVALNLQHDPAIRLASTAEGTLRLANSAAELRIEADLPAGAALDLARRGALRDISVEFVARREVRADGVRVITAADLLAIGLVDRGSYAAPVQVRAEVDGRRARLRRALHA